jgi:hypothetical protein
MPSELTMMLSPTFKDLNNDLKDLQSSKAPNSMFRRTISDFHKNPEDTFSVSERVENKRRSNGLPLQYKIKDYLIKLSEEAESNNQSIECEKKMQTFTENSEIWKPKKVATHRVLNKSQIKPELKPVIEDSPYLSGGNKNPCLVNKKSKEGEDKVLHDSSERFVKTGDFEVNRYSSLSGEKACFFS